MGASRGTTTVGTLGLTNRRVGGKVCRRVLGAIASVTVMVVPVVAVQAPAGAATGGVTITNFTDPTIKAPQGITVGPDGALWFVNNEDGSSGSIGRIATDGTVTELHACGRHRHVPARRDHRNCAHHGAQS